jgi:aminopeptidase N
MSKALFLLVCILYTFSVFAQPLHQKTEFTRQDSLRGSIGPGRSGWNVLRYNISVTPDYSSKTISGQTEMVIDEKFGAYSIQIDLQEPMILDKAAFDGQSVDFRREGNVYWLFVHDSNTKFRHKPGRKTVLLSFHGKPRAAVNPPWDGGWIWTKDKQGNPWMSVACQGLGASVWYPCKDHQSDEPEEGASLSVIVPQDLVAVGNGRLKTKSTADGKTTYTWEVTNPINNYNIIPYIGKYVNWSDTLQGEKGKLDLNYWVLEQDLDKAKKHFTQVKPMLRAFEYWFGPYPFYEDGFQLVQAPHLGMEHQSAIAYGNQFKNGYLGQDLSGSGWGLKWDYIIVHEAGHEWFANNITTKDIADMWVHEGFTNYSEPLYVEYHYGKQAGNEYAQGLRRNIENEAPIIGSYGVNQEGSGDMYAKGANLLHTIRQIINDDAKFRAILRGLNKDFYHQTVTSKQVEDYISQKSGKDFSKVFDQYLRTAQIPTLEFKAEEDKLKFKWVNCIPGFDMLVRLSNGQWIYPTTAEQKIKVEGKNFSKLTVDPNFYINIKQ